MSDTYHDETNKQLERIAIALEDLNSLLRGGYIDVKIMDE